MEDDNLDERTLEVLNIPESIPDDLLSLYFESKRSGGGALTSLDIQDGKATLVFEDARGRWHPVLIVRDNQSHAAYGIAVENIPKCISRCVLICYAL